tara:strand:- start:15022 stop:15423 length:402 start_codon:yes stop_codon:yes gene_type:complete
MNELISLFMGTGVGALTKVIGLFVSSSIQLNKAQLEANQVNQKLADDSADRASDRGGQWVRRLIVIVCLFGVVVVPFIMAFMDAGVTVSKERSFLFFEWETWKTLGGFVILPEIRTTLIAIVGYYFGSSAIKQ